MTNYLVLKLLPLNNNFLFAVIRALTMDAKYTLLYRRTEAAKSITLSVSRLVLCLTASVVLLCLSYYSGRASVYKDLHSEIRRQSRSISLVPLRSLYRLI